MKSKTSFFNITLFKKNFTHYWPLWVLYLCYLITVIPANIWLGMTENSYGENITLETKAMQTMLNMLTTGLDPLPVFVAAAIAAVAVFSYMYFPRSVNMIHALPVSRLELFVTNYASGLVFLIIPEFLTFLIAVLVCAANQVVCMQFLFLWFLYIAGITFFAYSLAVFVAMFTGQIFAMPVYYFILNYLYVGCLYIVSALTGLVSYGIVDFWNPGKSCILSPMYYLGNNLRVNPVYVKNYDYVTGISITGEYLVGIYAVVALILVVAAYQLYKRRQIETAGDLISIGIVKPIFRWGVALCGGVGAAIAITRTILNYRNIDIFPCLFISLIVLGFICFFFAEMLLQKTFRVFKKKRILEWIGFSVTAVIFLGLFHMDAFGIERRLPAQDEIVAAFINMDYPVEVSKEEYTSLIQLHQTAIKNKKFYLENSKGEKGYFYTTICYYLKDGSKLERRYPIPTIETEREDADSPVSTILQWERKEDNLLTQVLGRDYENNRYYTCSMDRYAEDGSSDNYIFNNEERKELFEAIKEDIKAGNFERYILYSINSEDNQSYYNGISYEYHNKNGIYDNWDYYRNYDKYASGEMDETLYSYGNYISFGKECVNTIKALERIGAIDDTWKLMTYDEYENTTQES